MAGYSDNRENNFEAKYLRKVLSAVDDNIRVPDSVRGDVLRRKLDLVDPPAPAAPDKKSGLVFGMRWFSWQSGLTYAAAFALIVGLFYGLGYHQQPRILDGNIELTQEQQQALNEMTDFDIAELQNIIVVHDDTDVADPAAGGADIGLVQPYVADDAVAPTPPESRIGSTPPQAPAVGGVGGVESEALGTWDGYSYTVRPNDANDPDKGAYPFTVDIISEESGELVAQIDLSSISAVEDAHFGDGTFSLVGSSPSGVATHTYSVAEPTQPVEIVVVEQPGSYISSRIYQNVVHTVTYSEDAADVALETEVLPYAITEGVCIITAADTVEAQTNQVAFLGADETISLFDRGAYITYEGEAAEGPETATDTSQAEDVPPEEVAEDKVMLDTVAGDSGGAETQKHYAQIILNGTEITLGTVS